MEETLGKRICSGRKRLGMTQDKLAEALGVTAQAVSKWENDQSCPDIAILPKLASIFGTSVDALLGVAPAESEPVHEAEIVKSLCGKTIVAACGGGAMLNPDTAKAARDAGAAVVFLDVPFDICYERISGDENRPIAAKSTKEELQALYESRRSVYLSHSTVKIDCGNSSPIEIAEKIAASVF